MSKERASTLKSDSEQETGFSLLSTIVLSTMGLGLPGAPSTSTSASNELSCSSEYVFMLDLLPVPFEQRRGTQQSDRCQAHSEDLHTHTHTVTVTFTYTHIYLPSLLGICQVIQSGCELTRVYYFSIYPSTWYLNSWISESVVQWMKVNFIIPKVA